MINEQNMEQLFLVTGATGRQGGAVARRLLKRLQRVRALTRDPEKPAARVLGGMGAELTRGDLDDRPSVERALEGAYGVFAVQNFWEAGYEREVRHVRRCTSTSRASKRSCSPGTNARSPAISNTSSRSGTKPATLTSGSKLCSRPTRSSPTSPMGTTAPNSRHSSIKVSTSPERSSSSAR